MSPAFPLRRNPRQHPTMPAVPPASSSEVIHITEDNWPQALQMILGYLDRHEATWIYYKIMPCSAVAKPTYNAQEADAKKVDYINDSDEEGAELEMNTNVNIVSKEKADAENRSK